MEIIIVNINNSVKAQDLAMLAAGLTNVRAKLACVNLDYLKQYMMVLDDESRRKTRGQLNHAEIQVDICHINN